MNVNFSILNPTQLPRLLLETNCFPQRLFVRGAPLDGKNPHLAIVGTRRASDRGMMFAKRLAYETVTQGGVIVSGLARGIDRAAHEGALSAGGKTIAVLPCGINSVYPHSHTALAEKIVQGGGALISEYPDQQPPHRGSFLARNRLIAGLCRATIVVEAPLRSGALNTAAHALSFNRDIGAVPGSPDNPLSAGTNTLIKQGAALIDSWQDVIDLMDMPLPSSDPLDLTRNPLETQIISVVRSGPIRIGELALQLDKNIPLAQLLGLIAELELRGLLECSNQDLLSLGHGYSAKRC